MWRAAKNITNDFLGRLAVIPMFRGPWLRGVSRRDLSFETSQDLKVVDALSVRYAKKVSHVAYRSKWFYFLCGSDNIDPKPKFYKLVHKYFHGPLKLLFNEENVPKRV